MGGRGHWVQRTPPTHLFVFAALLKEMKPRNRRLSGPVGRASLPCEGAGTSRIKRETVGDGYSAHKWKNLSANVDVKLSVHLHLSEAVN